ncbi:MAG: hypothetical protein IPL59_11220 [Candidatus Competibacteraceae bacterium]|nr:hypothetical protein [Candidatus Competibacteraceae bacterium]
MDEPVSSVPILEFSSRSEANAGLSQNRIDRWAGIALVTVLVMGCFAILRPFLSALLWAVILSFLPGRFIAGSNGPSGREGLAAGLMVGAGRGSADRTVGVPRSRFGGRCDHADRNGAATPQSRAACSPAWVVKLPVVGSGLHDRWQAMAGSGAKLTAELVHYLIPLRDWALGRAAGLGGGILSLSLSVFIAFFSTRTARRSRKG